MRTTALRGWRRARRPRHPDLTVVVPTLNEADNLEVVLPELAQTLADLPGEHEVILVDGGSVDDTVDVALETMPDITVVEQTRTGKGNALATGFEEAHGDAVVMFDADGSADPAEIPAFVEALVEGADFAKGSRFADGGASEDITAVRRAGNAFLNGVANQAFDTEFTDLCYGYNAFWTDMVPVLDLPDATEPPAVDGELQWGDGFEIETVINVRMAAADAVITEVASVERERFFGDSNLHAVRDGIRVLRTIVAERLRLGRRSRRTVAPPPGPAGGLTAVPGGQTRAATGTLGDGVPARRSG